MYGELPILPLTVFFAVALALAFSLSLSHSRFLTHTNVHRFDIRTEFGDAADRRCAATMDGRFETYRSSVS